MEDTKEFKVSVEAGVPNENDYKIEHEADERVDGGIFRLGSSQGICTSG